MPKSNTYFVQPVVKHVVENSTEPQIYLLLIQMTSSRIYVFRDIADSPPCARTPKTGVKIVFFLITRP